jgi:hypothetical protein
MAAPTIERYPATVTVNEDPDKRGRIKVNCPGIVGDEDGELPMFIEPALDWGWFYIPDVGEIIEIEVETGLEQDESFAQSSIDNLNAKWRGVRFYGNEDGDEPTKINDVFTKNQKTRGFATPLGHYMIFDDTEDTPVVTMTWVKKKDAGEEDISQITFTNDSIKLSYLKKQSIELKDGEIEIKLSDGAAIKITGKDSDAETVLGNGAVKAAIADHLKDLWNSLKQKLDTSDNHTHPTGMGPSGPPNPTISCPSWDSSIESSKLTFPDG